MGHGKSRQNERKFSRINTDHPNPLYIPPDYLVVTFYVLGGLRTRWHFESVYGGEKI